MADQIVQTAEERLAALEARITALESKADTLIVKAGNYIATHAPTVLKAGLAIGVGYVAAKLGVFSLITKLL